LANKTSYFAAKPWEEICIFNSCHTRCPNFLQLYAMHNRHLYKWMHGMLQHFPCIYAHIFHRT
jgi:hypothetical protein